MNFATAPRSFSRHRVPQLDGAFWAHTGILAGSVGLPAVPVHRLGLDWPRCFHSLGVALGRARMREFEIRLGQEAWEKSPIARRDALFEVVERVQIGPDGQPDETTRVIEVLE